MKLQNTFKKTVRNPRVNKIFFSSLIRRIFLFNLIGLIVMMSSILYLNSIQDNLIEARVENLKVEGMIIAQAIGDTSKDIIIFPELTPEELLEQQVEEEFTIIGQQDEHIHFPINPVRISPILRNLITPTQTRAKIFDTKGHLIVDSKHLYFNDETQKQKISATEKIIKIIQNIIPQRKLPIYNELANENGFIYQEVRSASGGNLEHYIRRNKIDETVLFVAVPIKNLGEIVGVLHLSTQSGDIDKIIREDRWAIINIFLVTSLVTLFLSMLLASTIATPLRRLADAAERVKIGIKRKEKIPDFSYRHDEIGHLSTALQDMTQSLYKRIEHIESFAADVSHELKNPLTSLRSAVETLPISKNEEQQKRLLKIIEHDVLRLDRLITDISDASRLDAELARQDPEPVDLAVLLQEFRDNSNERAKHTGYPPIHLHITEPNMNGLRNQRIFTVGAHKDRLAQVLVNIIDNSKAFIDPDNGKIDIFLTQNTTRAIIEICDNGVGIDPDNFERIFERFYTDRPEHETFGQNSGLGLSITRQIIEAHGGRIIAKNNNDGGACFRICLPLCKGKRKK